MKILYFSTVNWKWIKQRPHFVAEGLAAEGIEVEYISLTPLFKQKKHKQQKIKKNLMVRDQYVIPFASKSKIIQYLNIKFIERIINKRYDVIFITHPEQYSYIQKALGYRPQIIYDCMDNIPYFYRGDYRNRIIEKEKKLCKQAQHIITSSYYLKEKILNEYNIDNNKVSVVLNAVDKNIATHVENDIPKKWVMKARNLVYIGTVAEWVDLELLNQYAKKHKEENIYLVGPIDRYIPKDISPNIHFMGKVEHRYVGTIISKAEILIIPFKVNELIRGVDPVKIYEYKTFNKFVVSAKWEELIINHQDSKIKFYNGLESFRASIDEIRNNNVLLQNEINKKYISINCWDKRIESYLEIMKKLSGRGE